MRTEPEKENTPQFQHVHPVMFAKRTDTQNRPPPRNMYIEQKFLLNDEPHSLARTHSEGVGCPVPCEVQEILT